MASVLLRGVALGALLKVQKYNLIMHTLSQFGFFFFCLVFKTGPEKSFFTGRVIRRWKGLPRGLMESPALEIFKDVMHLVPWSSCRGGVWP